MAVYSLGERKVVLNGDCFIADNATVVGSVVIHDRASLWFNVVARGDNDIITIGERSNVQDGAVLHADPGIPLTLGKNVSVGHKAMLHGCTVGDGALVGIDAVVMNHAVIGRGSLIGAGALVTEGKNIPEGVLVLGSPAKVIRELTPEEKDGLLKIAESYVQRSKLFREQMRPQKK
ncbi:MAG TPA: gamma carbonic anhydrase family protein [Burkholderiales bacterium]|nr:gamma carbonic anhydrase family protein [Burkholderiales bacterium]